MATMSEKLQEIELKRRRLQLGVGFEEEIEKQHRKGKLTARERIDKLLDSGSFHEIDLWSDACKTGFEIDEREIPGDAVVVGHGEVGGRPIYVWAQDTTILGGTIAEQHIRKIVSVMEKALQEMVPIVGIYDSEGMRVENMVHSHSYFTLSTMMRFQTISSGVIPQLSLIMGPCTGGAALSAALSDFVFMVKKTSHMYIAPPPPGIDPEELGEARMHSRLSGCCDVLAEDDEDCLQKCKELLSFLPLNNLEKPPLVDTGDDPNRQDEELLELVPVEPSKWFDMRQLIRHVVDNQHYFELRKDYAANLTTGLARLNGQTVGIIGNNSIWRGGCHDVNASDKHGRFTRFYDAFNIPLIYFADSPAFYPSLEEERRGILRHGCMVIHSTAEATVPQITLYIRKCYGGGNLAMPCNILKADRLIGWPSADRGLMGPEGMMSILWRKQLAAAKTPEEVEKVRREGIKAMEETIKRSTQTATESFIDPRETRPTLIRELKFLANKTGERPWRKHENINL